MEYAEGVRGRVFILRLCSGEVLHESIEGFCRTMSIGSAEVTAVGGADEGSVLTVGPEVPAASPVVPLHHVLSAPHEFTGTGTVFRDEKGTPVLHMHCSCGREGHSVTGCVRSGVRVWLVMEVVISEIICSARRIPDGSGFSLLRPDPKG